MLDVLSTSRESIFFIYEFVLADSVYFDPMSFKIGGICKSMRIAQFDCVIFTESCCLFLAKQIRIISVA